MMWLMWWLLYFWRKYRACSIVHDEAAWVSTVSSSTADSDDDLSERAQLKKTTNSLQKQVLHLLSENKRLRQRDAMHVCSVLKSNLQPCSCALVENSLFSHTLSYPDDVLDSIEVDILQSVKKLKPLSTLQGTFGRVHVYTMLGRRCVFKTYPSEKDRSSLLLWCASTEHCSK